MKKQKTIYHILVDKSGSMSDCIDQTIDGFNEQLGKIKELEVEFPEQLMTIGLTTFNSYIQHRYFMEPTSRAYKMSRENYIPDHLTAMLDAMGDTMLKLTALQHQSNQEMPTTVVMVILTDGHENSSHRFSLRDIKEMIEQREATGTWTFSFLGATLDAADVAEQMSIRRENSIFFNKDEMKSQVWDKLGDSMNVYYNKKRNGENLRNFF